MDTSHLSFMEPTPGRTLYEERKRLGIGASELSAAIGIHRVTLHQWEAPGRTLDPRRVFRYRSAVAEVLRRGMQP